MPSLFNFGLVALEKKILEIVNVFSLFLTYLPLEKGGGLYLKKLEFPLPKDVCVMLFKKIVNVFSLLRNYLSLEKDENLHLKKLESFSPKDALW